VDCAAAGNLQRVQAAMAEERVGPHHFAWSTGYGHGDLGRAAYDQVGAFFMKSAIVVA
jgi:cystathionine beta-lyase family protein involved in aluminum resistance